MTIDPDTRVLLDNAFTLSGDLATAPGAGERIRSHGGRVLRRRRLAAASASVGVAAVVAAVVLGIGASGTHRSSPPAAPIPTPVPTPGPTFASALVNLTVTQVSRSHPQNCADDEWQSLDLSTCYALAAQTGLNTITFGNMQATLTVPKMPPAEKVDAAVPPATIALNPPAGTRQVLALLGTRGDRFVFAAHGRPFAERTGAQLNAAQLRFTGAPDVMQHAWDLLIGQTWTPPPAALPPNDASPEDVVRAYIGALNRHNEATVKALRAEGANGMEPWAVENIVSITHLQITSRVLSGSSSLQTANVQVRFNLRQIRVDSQLNGNTVWGYTLIRADGTQPWRILEEGVG